jgi:hypothetical protein
MHLKKYSGLVVSGPMLNAGEYSKTIILNWDTPVITISGNWGKGPWVWDQLVLHSETLSQKKKNKYIYIYIYIYEKQGWQRWKSNKGVEIDQSTLPLEPHPSASFPFVLFRIGSRAFASDHDLPTYHLHCTWDHKCIPPFIANWLRWGLTNFLFPPRLASNWDPPNSHFPSSWDYSCKSPNPA